MEERDDLLLKGTPHVYQDVPATDQVEPRKWRVFDHILLGENDAVPDAVGEAGRDRAERHAVEFGLGGILDQRDAAGFLDLAETERALGSGAADHDDHLIDRMVAWVVMLFPPGWPRPYSVV